MGYAHGHNAQGQEIGYAVRSICDESDCDEFIDRGLYYLCGIMPDDEFGCNRYFCGEHLFLSRVGEGWRCGNCLRREGTEYPEDEDNDD